MGKPKQLLPLHGLPIIEHSLKTLSAGGACPLVLVVGAMHDDLAPIGKRYGAHIVRNPAPDGDMASSVLAGLNATDHNITGVLIHPGDYPLVQPKTIEVLIDRHNQAQSDILIPVYNERRGHPALFPRALLDNLGNGTTLRDIINAHPDTVRLIAVDDSGILQDVDTPEDYATLLGGGRK